MHVRSLCIALAGIAASIPLLAADWSPRLAADYLDQRQKLWFEWAPAQASGGPCVSCHTGMTYLLARPLLRKVLDEKAPTAYEDGLLKGLRARAANGESMFPSFEKEPSRTQGRNFEAALALLLLRPADRPGKERLRTFQDRAEGDRGLWGFQFALAPWETDSSSYFTAGLVALAAREWPDPGLPGVSAFMTASFAHQPLHQKLMSLWAGVPVLKRGVRAELENEIWKRQAPDGSWTDEALGPWPEGADRPDGKGPSAYATAFAAFVLQQAGIGCADEGLSRAKVWLRSNQDSKTGAWRSASMNKKYAPNSMPSGFMDDAATGFAVMALLDSGRCRANGE